MRYAAVFLFVDARRPSSPCDTSGKKATLAALTPTHCVRCCPFFRADRRWLSGEKGNAPSVLRLVSLPAVAFSMQIASLSGKIRNAPSVLRLVSLPAVAFSMQIASLSGKILLAARCALTLTHCARCCPFFRGDCRWLSGQDGGTLAAFVLRQQSQMAGEGCRRIYAACSIRRPEGYWHGAAFDVAAGV